MQTLGGHEALALYHAITQSRTLGCFFRPVRTAGRAGQGMECMKEARIQTTSSPAAHSDSDT